MAKQVYHSQVKKEEKMLQVYWMKILKLRPSSTSFYLRHIMHEIYMRAAYYHGTPKIWN